MARKVYELVDGVQVYNKDDGDYALSKELIVDYKGQKGNTFVRSLQDRIFKYFNDLPKTEAKEVAETKDDDDLTADAIIGIVSISGNSADLYEAIINSLKAFGEIGGKKCTAEILDGLSEDDNDLIYEKVIEDFLSKKVIQRMKSMSK